MNRQILVGLVGLGLSGCAQTSPVMPTSRTVSRLPPVSLTPLPNVYEALNRENPRIDPVSLHPELGPVLANIGGPPSGAAGPVGGASPGANLAPCVACRPDAPATHVGGSQGQAPAGHSPMPVSAGGPRPVASAPAGGPPGGVAAAPPTITLETSAAHEPGGGGGTAVSLAPLTPAAPPPAAPVAQPSAAESPAAAAALPAQEDPPRPEVDVKTTSVPAPAKPAPAMPPFNAAEPGAAALPVELPPTLPLPAEPANPTPIPAPAPGTTADPAPNPSPAIETPGALDLPPLPVLDAKDQPAAPTLPAAPAALPPAELPPVPAATPPAARNEPEAPAQAPVAVATAPAPAPTPGAGASSSGEAPTRDDQVSKASAEPTAMHAEGAALKLKEAGRAAARVGDEVITLNELTAAVKERMTKLPAGYRPNPQEIMMLTSQVLDVLIERSTIVQEAKRELKKPEQIKMLMDFADKAWRDEELPPLLRKLSVENEYKLKEKLAEQGTSLDSMRETYRLEFLARGFLEQKLKHRIVVTIAEMREYYNAHLNDFNRPEQWIWREVLIEMHKHPSRAAARAKAEAVLARLRRGEDFAQVAQAESEGPNRAAGGLWETGPDSYAVAPVNDAIRTLPIGQVSVIIEGPSSYHLVRVDTRRSAGPASFAEVQDRIRRIVKNRRVEKESSQFLDKLRQETVVTTMFDRTDYAPTASRQPNAAEYVRPSTATASRTSH